MKVVKIKQGVGKDCVKKLTALATQVPHTNPSSIASPSQSPITPHTYCSTCANDLTKGTDHALHPISYPSIPER